MFSGTDDLGSIFGWLSEMVNNVINYYSEIRQTVMESEVRYEKLEKRIAIWG
jgi:hypothetical protein